jgi:hypothetical protein
MGQSDTRLMASPAINMSIPQPKAETWERLLNYLPLGLFLLSFFVLLRTLCPTVYSLDSAELATGAAVLGIVHTPGYPLYLLLAHSFTYLPFGDVAFRVNLFSAVCLALTTPILYSLLYSLTRARWVSAATALTFVWSYYLWNSGNKAEVYAPQVVTLALCGWSLVKMYQEYQSDGRASAGGAARTGLLFGVAMAMAQSSIFFAPGIAVCFLLMRVPLRVSFLAGLLSAAVFLAVLLYFPLRGSAYPEFNKIGFYDARGIFHNYDFNTPQGVLQAISGEQFRHLFFTNGLLPSLSQLGMFFSWLWRNYLGVGVLLGLAGAVYLFNQRRGLFLGWAALAFPYTYFYICYGAIDRDTMFGPTYLTWAVLLAFGLNTLHMLVPKIVRYSVMFGLPALALVTNFAAVDLSGNTSVRNHAQAVLESLPQDAVVAGYWADITPLQYLQFVENQRPDLKIYDLFMFKPDDFHTYVEHLSTTGQTPIVLTSTAIMDVPDSSYRIEPILTYLPESYMPIELPILAGFLISK